jgi:hypothetical protein
MNRYQENMTHHRNLDMVYHNCTLPSPLHYSEGATHSRVDLFSRPQYNIASPLPRLASIDLARRACRHMLGASRVDKRC